MSKFIIFLALALILLNACNTVNPSPQATVVTTESPTSLPSATTLPTDTPVPPTETPPPPTNTPTITPTPLPQAVGPKDFPPSINPLTGLPVNDPRLLERRPLAVKIQLFPRNQRPPWGVSSADIVYDYYANNGMTRLIAVFLGTDAEQVGPIRSARLFDEQVIRMYKAMLAFGGGYQAILDQILDADIYNQYVFEGGSNNCPPMCRIEPEGFNYLVTNTAELSKYADRKGIENGRQNLDGMKFDIQTPVNGKPGEQLSIHHSLSAYNRWEYNANSGRYLRFQDTIESDQGQGEVAEPFIDRLNDQQVAADNVVVLLLPHAFFQKSGKNEIIDIQLSGSGTAYAFRDGQVYEVRWNRPSSDSVVFLTFPDGTLYPLKPGNTWFEVIGQSSRIPDPQDGQWRFEFTIP